MTDPTPPPTDPATPPPADPATPPVDEWKPPSKEDWEKLVKQRDSLKARQREQEEKERAAAAEKLTTEQRQAQEATTAQVNKTKRLGAITALVEAGLTREAAKQAVRLVDLDAVEIDQDDDVDASDAVKALKEQFPQLFYRQRGNGGAPERVTRDRSGGEQGLTADQRHTRRLLGQAGY